MDTNQALEKHRVEFAERRYKRLMGEARHLENRIDQLRHEMTFFIDANPEYRDRWSVHASEVVRGEYSVSSFVGALKLARDAMSEVTLRGRE